MISFFYSLKSEIKRKIYIKNQNILTERNLESAFKKKLNFHNFENEKKSFVQIEKKYDIFLHISFGTPFFEGLVINKPTIVIYSLQGDPFEPYDKKFKSYISQLQLNNMLFYNEKKAAEFINNNYFNLDKWWNQNKIQKIRNNICLDYCFSSNQNMKIMKNLFKNV